MYSVSIRGVRGLKVLLAKGAGGEEFADEVEGAVVRVDPGGVELHDGWVVEVLEEVDLRVEPLQLHRRVEHVVELHLVPRHLHPGHLIESLVHRLHGPFPQHFLKLQPSPIASFVTLGACQ